MDWNGWTELRWPLYLLPWARIPQKKWSSHHNQQESPKWGLECCLKNDRIISIHFQGKPFNIIVIQVYALTSKAEVEWFSEDLLDLLELTPKENVLFFIGDWHAKVGSQEIPGVTGKFSLRVQNEAGQRLRVLPRECTGHSKHPLPTTQEKPYTWTSTVGQYQNQTDCILCSQRWKSSIQSAKTSLGADCGSHYELIIDKFRL